MKHDGHLYEGTGRRHYEEVYHRAAFAFSVQDAADILFFVRSLTSLCHAAKQIFGRPSLPSYAYIVDCPIVDRFHNNDL